MPEYLSPGVYVEEIGRGPKPIEGVATSTAAFLGETERGMVQPRLVSGVDEFARWFGGLLPPDKFLPDAVRGFFENGGQRLYICRIASASATTAEASCGPNFTLRARGSGSWGTRVYASIEDSSTIMASDHGPVPVGFRLRLAYYTSPPSGDPFDWFIDSARSPRPQHAEDFDDLVPEASSPDYWELRLNESSLVQLVRAPTAPPGSSPERSFKQLSVGGLDGPAAITSDDFEGDAVLQRCEVQSLAALALERYDDVSLVYAPATSLDVAERIVMHCEKHQRFAVIDGPRILARDFAPRNAIGDTSYAAFYFPWIQVSDVAPGSLKQIPPGGHVAGVYARTEIERGVHKAPANAVLTGALGLSASIDVAEHERLTPLHINTIRELPGRGIRVWGARTLSSNAEWKYVSVRRLFTYIERSIDEGSQWVVFEPNDARLWDQVVSTVSAFLLRLWRDGALLGAKSDEAFFVRCDRTTMTQDDIDGGRLVCTLGIAPIKPAEFLILRICKRTA